MRFLAGLSVEETAMSGDSSRAQSLADDLEKRFPEDTFARFTYVPVLRGLSASKNGKPAGIRPLAVAGIPVPSASLAPTTRQ
jgi:hypothetical protein